MRGFNKGVEFSHVAFKLFLTSVGVETVVRGKEIKYSVELLRTFLFLYTHQ
jgi:hypothetical protein